jgi:uncharacterized protein YijF (DUF1287 family)
VVSARKVPGSERPLVVHNIGAGTRVEDVLFAWDPVGHFRISTIEGTPPPPAR